MTFQLSYPQKKTSNSSIYAVLGICIGLAFVSAWYFYIEPIYSITNPSFSSFATFIASINFNSLTANFQQNWWQYTIGSLGVISAISAIASKINSIHAERAKQQAQLETIDMQTQFVKQSSELVEAKKTIETQTTQLQNSKTSDSAKLLEEAQALVTTKTQAMEKMQLEHQATVTTLQNEIDRLKIKTKEVIVVK